MDKPKFGGDHALNPRDCSAFTNRIKAAFRRLEAADGALNRAWEGELKRVYGYDFIRGPAGEPGAVEAAQAAWLQARSEFIRAVQIETVYPVDELGRRSSEAA